MVVRNEGGVVHGIVVGRNGVEETAVVQIKSLTPDTMSLTNIHTDCLLYITCIRYSTAEPSSWRHDITIPTVQVDLSIITSVSTKFL